jgi:hypothetical protein
LPELGNYANPTATLLNALAGVQEALLLATDSAQKAQGAVLAGDHDYAVQHAVFYQYYVTRLKSRLATLKATADAFRQLLASDKAPN